MTNYENDEDEIEGNEPEEEEGAAPASNRNFLLALGILGGIFLLLLLALAAYLLTRPRTPVANIDATNQVIMTANAETAAAATQAAAFLLTPSVTSTATNTLVPPTATNTQVVALATASGTPVTGAGGALTLTPNLQTATIAVQLTLNAQQTQTQAVKLNLTGTATALPKTGFAEDVGLPGLFGMAVGLVLVIVLVRRLRLSPGR